MINIELNEIIKGQFINDWTQNEWKEDDKNYDPNADKRLKLHYKDNDFIYGVVEFEESDLGNIVLPNHIHDSINVPQKGMYLDKFAIKYADEILNLDNSNCCIERIRFLLKRFEKFPTELDYIMGKFMYVTNDSKLGVEGHYSLPGIYSGSFHQFAAYSVWLNKYAFKPLRLYYLSI